jgi:hypothetical protein
MGFGAMAALFGCLERYRPVNSKAGNARSAYGYLGVDALASLPNAPRFPPIETHGAASKMSMPRRAATRRAVASRSG